MKKRRNREDVWRGANGRSSSARGRYPDMIWKFKYRKQAFSFLKEK